MQKIEFKISAPKHKGGSARADLIFQFQEKINISRKGKKMKPLSSRFFGFKLAHLSVEDLRWFLDKCRASPNFSRCFFGNLKIKK